MYALLHELFEDKKGGEIFTCFGTWHLGYILLTLVVAALLLFALRHREQEARRRAARFFIGLAFGLYILDFFLMPFAYGEIDMEKLPFHVCTASCVACFLTSRVRALEKLRVPCALLGFVSNLVYLIYPAGVMWHAVHPLCYRVVQTLLFHAVMTVYGLLTITAEREALARRKTVLLSLLVVVGMTVWAVLGNALYDGAAGSYDHSFNWFFVLRDPFGLLPRETAPYIMPFVNIVLFSAVELLIIGLARTRGPKRKRS